MSKWEEKLELWFKESHYELDNKICIEEFEETGKSKIEFTNSNGRLLKMNWGNKNHLVFLKDDKNSDGVFLEFDRNDDVIALHFVELKKSVSLTKWDEIKTQIRSSLRHSLGFLGVIDVKIPDKLICHSCYQEDKTQQEIESKFLLNKPRIGKKLDTENLSLQKWMTEWKSDQVKISSVFPEFEHKKHLLVSNNDEIPSAQVTL